MRGAAISLAALRALSARSHSSLPVGTPLDGVSEKDAHRWQVSPHAKLERLLSETEVPIGLLSNGAQLRLVYAPRGETITSGNRSLSDTLNAILAKLRARPTEEPTPDLAFEVTARISESDPDLREADAAIRELFARSLLPTAERLDISHHAE